MNAKKLHPGNNRNISYIKLRKILFCIFTKIVIKAIGRCTQRSNIQLSEVICKSIAKQIPKRCIVVPTRAMKYTTSKQHPCVLCKGARARKVKKKNYHRKIVQQCKQKKNSKKYLCFFITLIYFFVCECYIVSASVYARTFSAWLFVKDIIVKNNAIYSLHKCLHQTGWSYFFFTSFRFVFLFVCVRCCNHFFLFLKSQS